MNFPDIAFFIATQNYFYAAIFLVSQIWKFLTSINSAFSLYIKSTAQNFELTY
jgi:hypothetical protein